MSYPEFEMYQEIPREEPGAENLAYGLNYDEFKNHLEKLICDENRVLDNDGTPTTTYIMYVDNYPVGDISIRTKINDYWMKYSGNIFYKVRPSERKKGYATKMLELALDECKKMGFSEVFLQSSDGNIGSAKTIENNGGILLCDDGSRYYKIGL